MLSWGDTERYGLGKVALQEIRWNDKGMLDIQDTIKFYVECNKHHQFGTGLALHKNLELSVREFKIIKPRISLLTIEAQYFDITIVDGHTPTEEKTQEEKDEFYDNSEHTLNKIPQSRIRIVLGDLNANLGKENILRSKIGNHSLHNVTSKNELRLIDFTSGGEDLLWRAQFSHIKISIRIHGKHRMVDISIR